MIKKSNVTNLRSIEMGEANYHLIMDTIDKEGGVTVARLREITGLGASSVSRHTLRLTREGKIHKTQIDRANLKPGGSSPSKYMPGPCPVAVIDESEDEEMHYKRAGGSIKVVRTTAVQTGNVKRNAFDALFFGSTGASA